MKDFFRGAADDVKALWSSRWVDTPRSAVGAVVHVWSRDRVSALGAEVAFFAMLSLFPAVLAVTAALGSLESIVGARVAQEAQEAVLSYLQAVLTEEAQGTIDAVREVFEEQKAGLLTAAVAGAIWTMSRAMNAVLNAMAVVYGVRDRRPWWKARLLAIALSIAAVFTTAAALAAFVLGPLLGTGFTIAGRFGFDDSFVTFWNVLRTPAAFLTLTAAAAVTFHVAPDRRSKWRWDLPGAFITATLWVAASLSLQAYVDFAGGNGLLAALGGALIVLLWLYFLSLAFVIGAEVNVAIIKRYAPDASELTGDDR